MKGNNTKHCTVHNESKTVQVSLKTVDPDDICLVIKAVKYFMPILRLVMAVMTQAVNSNSVTTAPLTSRKTS
jgi:hypothetical protein